jgi:hypothetical protein
VRKNPAEISGAKKGPKQPAIFSARDFSANDRSFVRRSLPQDAGHLGAVVPHCIATPLVGKVPPLTLFDSSSLKSRTVSLLSFRGLIVPVPCPLPEVWFCFFLVAMVHLQNVANEIIRSTLAAARCTVIWHYRVVPHIKPWQEMTVCTPPFTLLDSSALKSRTVSLLSIRALIRARALFFARGLVLFPCRHGSLRRKSLLLQ